MALALEPDIGNFMAGCLHLLKFMVKLCIGCHYRSVPLTLGRASTSVLHEAAARPVTRSQLASDLHTWSRGHANASNAARLIPLPRGIRPIPML
jgi:hypothetical protein